MSKAHPIKKCRQSNVWFTDREIKKDPSDPQAEATIRSPGAWGFRSAQGSVRTIGPDARAEAEGRSVARRQLPLCIGDNYTRASGVAPNR